MTVALWIIAICEIIRAAQNALQIWMLRKETGMRKNAYQEFIKSLKESDKQFVKDLLDEFERQEGMKDDSSLFV